MREGPDIAALASLIGDPARANILTALMSGMSLTAGELSREAGVAPQTASSHLAKLVTAGLILAEFQGRHRYFRLAGQDVAGALEGLMELAARNGQLRTRPGPRDAAMRKARSCYDHLAGEMGVRLYEALVGQGFLVVTADGLDLSPRGRRQFIAEGIDVCALKRNNRPLCRSCLDWSERRHHLAGPLGAAILGLILDRGWASRDRNGRAILFSGEGERRFADFLGKDSGRLPRLEPKHAELLP